MMLYFYCFIPVYFSLERLFVLFCFVLFSFVCCYTCWILAFLCGRETRSTCFILNTLVLHLYLLSIPVQLLFLLLALSFYMYLVQSSQFSFEESTLLLHLYLFGECSNKFIGVWLDQKMCYACGSGIKCLHESLQIIVLSYLILVNSFELSSMSCLSLFIM